MKEFTKQDWALIHDLINLTWSVGGVKSPQMGQNLEMLRGKVLAQIEPPPAPPGPPTEEKK